MPIIMRPTANPHGLTDKAPLRLHLRFAFHDWLWGGGSKDECGWRRRLARRLPLYFTDPDMLSKSEMKRIKERAQPRTWRIEGNTFTATGTTTQGIRIQ